MGGAPSAPRVRASLLPSYPAGCVSPQIRGPAFLDLFMQSLFKPGARINQDHKHKYIHILAYAASVVETWKKVPSALRVPAPRGGRVAPSSLWRYLGISAARNHEPISYQKCLVSVAQKTVRVLGVSGTCTQHPVLSLSPWKCV